MHYNCLIVDDEEELAKMTAEYFRMFDVSTAYVTSGEACFAFLEENTADLILLATISPPTWRKPPPLVGAKASSTHSWRVCTMQASAPQPPSPAAMWVSPPS